jgi:urea carboxylase/allophanate hydrolase
MDIKSIAIFSDADARAPHVTAADVALPLIGKTVSDTYLMVLGFWTLQSKLALML